MPKGRILVVEDSRAQADKVAEVLMREGYEVVMAADGGAAVKKLQAGHVDLVLLDMVLPDQPGIDVLRKMKAVTREAFVPVVILSATSDLDARVKAFQNGADDYIGKDSAHPEILARVGAMRRIKQLQDELRQARDKLEQLSVTDGLTELFNHRHFQTRLREEFGRAQRHGDPLTLLMLDLDRFKDVNDRWLHPFGDKVLKETAVLIRNSLRDHDISARYGGEEFAVILPKTHLPNGLLVARRIGRAVADHVFLVDGSRDPDTGGPQEVHVTASGGAASFPGSEITTPEQLVKRADEALFKAKKGGRDRIWAFQGQFFEDDPRLPLEPTPD